MASSPTSEPNSEMEGGRIPSDAGPGDGIPNFYASAARLRSSVFDLTVMFGRMLPVGVKNEQVLQWECRVSMSPAHAKSLLRLLESQIKEYERKHGRLPDTVKGHTKEAD